MSELSDEVTQFGQNLSSVYSAIAEAGGEMPETKNVENLAGAIRTIPRNEYGLIIYTENGAEKTYSLASNDDFHQLCASSWQDKSDIVFEDVTIPRASIVAFDFGTKNDYVGDYFLGSCTNLERISEIIGVNSIGGSFLFSCTKFNSPIIISGSVETIGNSFLVYCSGFNSSVTIKSGVKHIGANFINELSAFNSNVILSDGLLSIGNGFLSANSKFDQSVILPNSLESIGNGFLQNCTEFNQPIEIPSSVVSLGNNFLSKCSNFNSTVSLSSKLSTIEWGFLSGCTDFNQVFNIPDTILSIGNNFLQGCTSFSQSITVPSNINNVGTGFMYQCNDFVGPLIYNSAATLTDNYSLATTTSTAKLYAVGVTVAGSHGAALVAALPNRNSSPYRKLILG